MAAPAKQIWELIADIRNTGRFSPETFEIGPVYWTTCRVTACEPGREFGFAVLAGDNPVNNWHYRLTPRDGGTDVTESFRLETSPFSRIYWMLLGPLRKRRNERDMKTTLERIKEVAEAA